MKKIKLILTTALLTTLIGCTNGDDYGTPELPCITKTANTDVLEDIMLPASLVGETATLWTNSTAEEDILEAYVTSSDEGGNFYKSISFVAYDQNGDQYGFSIPVNQYNLYTAYEPGRKVYIKLNGLHYGESIYTYTQSNVTYNVYNGTLLGGLNGSEVGRIEINKYKNALLRSCDKLEEDDLVHHISIAEAQNDSYLNKLIEFDNVQFANSFIGKTYFDPSNTAGSGTNNMLVDENGNSVIVRVSEFANFTADKVPSGNGRVRGVMTKYRNDYQFMIRTTNDVKLDNPRQDFTFLNSVNEPFTSYAVNATSFTKYFNLATTGTYKWQVKSFSNNQYIQMSSFGSGGSNRALFAIPVNFNNISSLSFKTKDGYNNGNALKVYYSTNFDPQNPNNGTLIDITSNFAIASGTASGYATNFTNSGTYNFSGLSGYGYVIFEYVGNASGGITTTMQIDDIIMN